MTARASNAEDVPTEKCDRKGQGPTSLAVAILCATDGNAQTLLAQHCVTCYNKDRCTMFPACRPAARRTPAAPRRRTHSKIGPGAAPTRIARAGKGTFSRKMLFSCLPAERPAARKERQAAPAERREAPKERPAARKERGAARTERPAAPAQRRTARKEQPRAGTGRRQPDA